MHRNVAVSRLPRLGDLNHTHYVVVAAADLTPQVSGVTLGVVKFEGQALRSAREARGLTQQELAFLAGIAVSTIQRAEYGEHAPTATTLIKIAQALSVPVDTLFVDGAAA